MTLSRKSRLVGLLIAVVVIAIAVFGYRQWKMAQLERFWLGVALRMEEHVFIPNHISVTRVFGGGHDWLGLGRDCNMSFDTRTSDRKKLVMFVNFESRALSFKVKDMLWVIHGRDMPRDPNELARLLSRPNRAPVVPLQEARTLDTRQWARLAASDPLGTIRIRIPADSMGFNAPFYLYEQLPGLFERRSVETEASIPLEPR